MSSRIHLQARTTPKIRQEIKDSGLSDREAATDADKAYASRVHRAWLRSRGITSGARSHSCLIQRRDRVWPVYPLPCRDFCRALVIAGLP